MADQELREAVARALAATRGAPGMWGFWVDEADAAIAAVEAHQGERRLKAHEHMVSNPAWAVEMFGGRSAAERKARREEIRRWNAEHSVDHEADVDEGER